MLRSLQRQGNSRYEQVQALHWTSFLSPFSEALDLNVRNKVCPTPKEVVYFDMKREKGRSELLFPSPTPWKKIESLNIFAWRLSTGSLELSHHKMPFFGPLFPKIVSKFRKSQKSSKKVRETAKRSWCRAKAWSEKPHWLVQMDHMHMMQDMPREPKPVARTWAGWARCTLRQFLSVFGSTCSFHKIGFE